MKIEQYRPADRTLARLSVTVSVGLAVSSRDMAPAQLLERADRALYTAKNLGKNRVYGDERT
jgi:diguanylate cyclase